MLHNNDTEIKLFCMISYIGPLFIVGRMIKSKYKSDLLEFHSWQGGMVFLLMFLLHSFISKVFDMFYFLPEIQEVCGILLYAGVFTMGLVLMIMGVINAFHGDIVGLPVIDSVEKAIKKHYNKLEG